MNHHKILIIRAVLGAGFGIILMRVFYPDAHPGLGIGLGTALVALAYVVAHFRNRKVG